MRTVFIFENKKLCEVKYHVPLDNGDSFDMPKPDTNFADLVIEYDNYKVIGRKFIYQRGFTGTLEIYLSKL